MSVDNTNIIDMEEICDMQREILKILEDEGRVDLIQVFKDMLDKIDELNYETESTMSSEDMPDLEPEEIEVKTDEEGFKSIV